MTIALIAENKNPLTTRLIDSLRQCAEGHDFVLVAPNSLAADALSSNAFVYLPSSGDRDGMTPDLREAKAVLSHLAQLHDKRIVVISSAMIYGTGPGRQFLVDETFSTPAFRGNIARCWQEMEDMARTYLAKAVSVVILRPCLVQHAQTLPVRLMARKLVASLPGHDPVMQLLSVTDLCRGVLAALVSAKSATYNVASAAVVHRTRGIHCAGGRRLPIPRTLYRVFRRTESLDYVRYPWTVASAKIEREIGFRAQQSSLAALLEQRNRDDRLSDPEPSFDEFGMDEDYVRRLGHTIFSFLSKIYWRIETKGMEHIPRVGRAILVGTHRGFVPLDGAMAVDTIRRETGRVPRFLTHPMLFKFPFLFNFMSKLGGVPACQESVAHILENEGLLGVFPEGVKGAFTLYRNAYKVQGFARDAFVKLALRYRAPIIPFVTVGSAEIFPIFGRIPFPWFKRYSGFPFVPITPTFPILPVPLPSKWHTQFLPPVEVDQYAPEAANDPAVVRTISREVRARMQGALDDMRGRRRSIFYGSIFAGGPDKETSKPATV